MKKIVTRATLHGAGGAAADADEPPLRLQRKLVESRTTTRNPMSRSSTPAGHARLRSSPSAVARVQRNAMTGLARAATNGTTGRARAACGHRSARLTRIAAKHPSAASAPKEDRVTDSPGRSSSSTVSRSRSIATKKTRPAAHVRLSVTDPSPFAERVRERPAATARVTKRFRSGGRCATATTDHATATIDRAIATTDRATIDRASVTTDRAAATTDLATATTDLLSEMTGHASEPRRREIAEAVDRHLRLADQFENRTSSPATMPISTNRKTIST